MAGREVSEEEILAAERALAGVPAGVPHDAVEAGANAIIELRRAYNERRAEASQRIFGHPGAHIATIPMPGPREYARAVLEAVQS